LLRAQSCSSEKPLFFVSRPRFFGVRYDINPWMSRNLDAVDCRRAAGQWNDFTKLLERCGAEVRALDCDDPRVPDVTFTANAGSFLPLRGGHVFVPARFRYDQRKPEQAFFAGALARAGARVAVNAFGDDPFEGDGDLLRLRDHLLVGHGFRTSAGFVGHIESALAGFVTPLLLVDPRFYHLDTCFFYHEHAGREICWYYPGAFTPQSLAALRALVAQMGIAAYEASELEAVTFCCNAVGVRSWIVADSVGAGLRDYLAASGFHVQQTPLSEFRKSGGSARCLVLRAPRCALAAGKPASGPGLEAVH
jgi:N-dimethylarginine dimethylaminohydrolase